MRVSWVMGWGVRRVRVPRFVHADAAWRSRARRRLVLVVRSGLDFGLFDGAGRGPIFAGTVWKDPAVFCGPAARRREVSAR